MTVGVVFALTARRFVGVALGVLLAMSALTAMVVQVGALAASPVTVLAPQAVVRPPADTAHEGNAHALSGLRASRPAGVGVGRSLMALDVGLLGVIDVTRSSLSQESIAADATAAATEGGTGVADDAASQLFRHYTDDIGRSGIEGDGSIAPGADGRVYVTTDEYASGADAQSGLALRRTPTGYFEVPSERLPGLNGPFPVLPANGQPGGGIEYWIEQAVDASGLNWVDLP